MICGIIIGAALVYARSLDAPFVYDDRYAIVDNVSIRRLADAIAAPPRDTPVAGRPAVNLSFALNYRLGGTNPFGYRVLNLVIHIGAALLVFGLVRRTLSRTGARPVERAERERPERSERRASHLAFASALIWCLHPLNTEAVAYVTQRTESLMGLLYLLTLYAASRAMAARRPTPWAAVSVAACALGMATKESMVTAPVVVLLYDAAFESGSVVRALHERRGLYLGLAASWIVLGVLMWPGPRAGSVGFGHNVTSWTYLLNQAPIVLGYLKLVVWPAALVLDYGPTAPVEPSDVALQAAIVLVLIGAVALAWWRAPRAGFLGAVALLTLVPTSSVVPIATEVGADRRMYLPLASIIVLLVVAASELLRKARIGAPGRSRYAGAALLIVVVAGLAVRSSGRAAEYNDPARLWRDVLEHRPHGRAHYNLAVILRDQGDRTGAIDHYRQALADFPDAHYAVGYELEVDGLHDEALAHLREFVRQRPRDVKVPDAMVLIGRALMKSGRPGEAADAYREALRMHPADEFALAGLGDAMAARGRHREAADAYRAYLQIVPTTGDVHHNLGVSLAAEGHTAEAIASLSRAVALEPDAVRHRLALGALLAEQGRLREALESYRQVLRLDPNQPDAREAVAELARALDRGQ
jgi:tetratricopeptide (TPR) repeat protein